MRIDLGLYIPDPFVILGAAFLVQQHAKTSSCRGIVLPCLIDRREPIPILLVIIIEVFKLHSCPERLFVVKLRM